MIIILQKGDFHIHSNASDGEYLPFELIKLAALENVDIISITDHDTTSAVIDVIAEGKKNNIRVIPGIELSTLKNNESIHILGYFNGEDYNNISFQTFLNEMNNFRINRAKKIVENLQTYFNINIDYENIIKRAHGIIARPHIAREIIEEGYNYSWEYIFENIIGENSPAYVPHKKLSTEEGIHLLKSVNALTVLAHPVLIKHNSINELLKLNFDGIEAIYYSNTLKDTEYFLNTAKTNKLIITAGSDFHGICKSDGCHADKIGAVFLNSDRINVFLEKLEAK